MDVKRIITKWRYFNLPRESVEGCFSPILQYNARSLMISSLAAACLVLLASFYPLLIEKELSKFIVYMITAIIELGVYFYTLWMETGELKDGPFSAGFLVFFSCIIFFGIYIGILTRPGEAAVNFMVFLICSQIVFVMPPLRELAINVTAVAVFSYLAIRNKPEAIWQMDMLNAVLASLAGMILSWQLSHVVIKEMLTAQRFEAERNRFEEESIRDDLTGLSNRRDLFLKMNFFITACQHVRQTVCVIMMDVDHFKLYNDFYGHLKGDQVLRAMGGVLSRLMVEEKVFAARAGGEEFIILWAENRLSEAQRLALRLRQRIIDLQIPHETSPVAPYITVSFGLYFLRGGSEDTAEELYERADRALYEAKRQGRDRIILFDSEEKIFRQVLVEDERKRENR
ncbi:hypothetical protein FACS189468_4210 [Spirochaetia bacterium]|nr:hypothetical protein FACS189468_4210 [Spirochaetia bacterium]